MRFKFIMAIKKIRVKPIFGNFTFYQEMVKHPPEGIDYLGIDQGVKEGKYYERKKLKEKIGLILQSLKIPRIMPIFPGNFDLIHSSRGIIPLQILSNKPWIMDIEHVHSFFGLNPEFIKNKFWKKFIEFVLSRKNCKAILCHCEATRQAFFYYLDCSKFKDKIKVVYPALHITPIKKENNNKIVILSVISIFNNKGGPQILKAFSVLEKKYKNIELILKADVPEEFKKAYSSKNIKYIGYLTEIIPRDKLLKDLYSKADIFLYPTMSDSFGASLLDAMIAKLPIVTTNLFAIPEIVENGKNGLVFKIPNYHLKKGYVQSYSWKELKNKDERIFIERIIHSLEKMILNKNYRQKMGEISFMRVKKGKFSIEKRNKKMLEIYKKALK